MGSPSPLSKKNCTPCATGTPPLQGEQLQALLQSLKAGWKIIEEHHLEKDYTFPHFTEALAFTNRVGELAEQEGHHPDIHLSYGKVKILLWTHKINSLTESDFILASKIDALI